MARSKEKPVDEADVPGVLNGSFSELGLFHCFFPVLFQFLVPVFSDFPPLSGVVFDGHAANIAHEKGWAR